MDRADGKTTLRGIVVDVSPAPDDPNDISTVVVSQETIDYFNIQLGKYSNWNGECHVGICYECYIDGLFQITRRLI